jgi:cardiolipin synthase
VSAIVLLAAFCYGLGLLPAPARPLTDRQKSLEEWRALTAPPAPDPRVFVANNQVRFFFPTDSGVEAFRASWGHVRVPSTGYRVHSAILAWDQKLARMPEGQRGWREATVISQAEWRRMTTNLFATLTPEEPWHAVYYQSFLADGVLYRDGKGVPRFAALGEQPAEAIIDHRYSVEETLDMLSRRIEEQLSRNHPGGTLFLVMAPNTRHCAEPILLDRQLRRCVALMPAALYDPTERGFTFTGTAQGVSAMFLEGQGLSFLKNPVSSCLRIGDFGFQTVVRLVSLPFPRRGGVETPVTYAPGMDLAQWEAWLDRYTGTRREQGSMELQIDGDRFYTRLLQAIAQATNHISMDFYIFDRDDIAVSVADQLKARSSELDIRIIMDRMGSIGAGMAPPSTPWPEDFTPPASISRYLKSDSKVRVHPSLNPGFTADHSKVCLIDGNYAWVGGMNIGREYRYEWHDMMVELQGPIVDSYERQFQRDWALTSPLGDLAYAGRLFSGSPPPPRRQPSTNWMQLRRLPTAALWKPFDAAVLGAIRHAQNYIYIENPYLFDKVVLADLVDARRRGVDVRVIMPRINDMKSAGRSNLVIANYLIDHGIRVYFYPGMTHVKALAIDGWCCVGSGNLNHLSLRVNLEQNIATSDPGFAARLNKQLFYEDFARSYELLEPLSVDWVDVLTDRVLENF